MHVEVLIDVEARVPVDWFVILVDAEVWGGSPLVQLLLRLLDLFSLGRDHPLLPLTEFLALLLEERKLAQH